ncbi:uncharacterized protein CLUP02_12032 [Colletotrichum lupini]|uniref:Secreted protein n=1 Tax=Colletotrichum lupini TaxID=145971 RepID=A0A9Q8T0H9_9PEZI|nr:uncharacterized protein CLUP02_12032 [Colletotrichum lupini]UQC86530.1 hypothetical protein CLUP02_12032 [Colletotrichum lupini]
MNAWVVAQLHRHVSFAFSLLVLGSGSKTIDYKIPPMSLLRYRYWVGYVGVAEDARGAREVATHWHCFVDIRRRL